MNSDIVNWMTWVAAIVPLWAIAWAAYHYVSLRRVDEEDKKFNRFFVVMDHLGREGSVASKMAAAFELRKFPEYAEVIIRMCEKVKVDGVSAQMLRDELNLTADFLSKKSGK